MHTHIPPDLRATVDAIAKSLAPNVVRIRYTVGEDWAGEPAIHFRVLLSDSASILATAFVGSCMSSIRHAYPFDVASRVEAAIRAGLDFDAMGLHDYYNFRSEPEQAALKCKEWE